MVPHDGVDGGSRCGGSVRVIVGLSPRAAGGTGASFGFRRDIPQIIFFPVSVERGSYAQGVLTCMAAPGVFCFLYATTRER